MPSALCIKHNSAIWLHHPQEESKHGRWDSKDVTFADIPEALGMEDYFSRALSVRLGADFLILVMRTCGPGRTRRKEDWPVLALSLVKLRRKPWPSLWQINFILSDIFTMHVISHYLDVCKHHETTHCCIIDGIVCIFLLVQSKLC